MSVTESSNSRQFLEALLTELDRFDEDLTDVLEAHHLDTATGEELGKIGNLGDIQRRDGESDEAYRERIRANLAVGNSDGTFEDLVQLSGLVLQTNETNITINTDISQDPVALVSVDKNIVSERTSNDFDKQNLVDVLNKSVSAGHVVYIESVGTFQLSSDTYNPPDGTGLTNDSGADGGTLGETIEP